MWTGSNRDRCIYPTLITSVFNPRSRQMTSFTGRAKAINPWFPPQPTPKAKIPCRVYHFTENRGTCFEIHLLEKRGPQKLANNKHSNLNEYKDIALHI